jgi:hypothetical protein
MSLIVLENQCFEKDFPDDAMDSVICTDELNYRQKAQRYAQTDFRFLSIGSHIKGQRLIRTFLCELTSLQTAMFAGAPAAGCKVALLQ